MKKINDEKVVKLVKENTNYKVKTTSQSILNQYAYESKLEVQSKTAKKHKKAVAFGTIFGTLAAVAAAVIAVVFISKPDIPKNDDSIIFPDTDPINNKVLKKQLITFSAFANQLETKTLSNKRMLKAQLLDDEDDEDEETTDKTEVKLLIEKAVDIYESVEKSVNYLYNEKNINTKTTNVSATFDNIIYSQVTKFYYDDNEKEFASYYFNEPKEENEDKEIKRISKAYYECGNLRFNIDVSEEVESEEDEKEIETTLILRDVDKLDKQVYVVEKEAETENKDSKVSSENSLSIITYKDEASYKNEDYTKKVTAETEVDNDENEIEVGVKTKDLEVEYRITRVNKFNLDLETELEELTNDEGSFENEHINLEYKDGRRIYTWNTSIWEF